MGEPVRPGRAHEDGLATDSPSPRSGDGRSAKWHLSERFFLLLPRADRPGYHALGALAGGEAVDPDFIHVEPVAAVAGAVDRVLVLVAPRRAPGLGGAFLHEDPQERSRQPRLALRSGRAGWADGARQACWADLSGGTWRSDRARQACGSDLSGRAWRPDGADLSGHALWARGSGRPHGARCSNRSDLSARPGGTLRSLWALVSGKTLRPLRARGAGRSLGTCGAGGSRFRFGSRLGACLTWRSGRALRADWPGGTRRPITPGFTLRPWRTSETLWTGDALRARRSLRSGRSLRAWCSVAPGLALRTGRAGLRRRKGGGGCSRGFRASLAAEADHHLPLLVVGLEVHQAGGRMIGKPEGEAAVGVGSRLVALVEGDGGLARFAQPSGHAQLPARDHGLIDDDVGERGCAAAEEDGSG